MIKKKPVKGKCKFCEKLAITNRPDTTCKKHYSQLVRKGFIFNTDDYWYKPHLTSTGYIRINVKNGKRVLYHRYLMEQHLGRKLEKNEMIHHRNGIKTDNRIENLEIVSQGEHIKNYHPKKPIIDWELYNVPKHGRGVVCLVCGLPSVKRHLCNKHYVSFNKNSLRY